MSDQRQNESGLWRFLNEKPWGPFLSDVDRELTKEVMLYCLGGFVLKALYDIPRVTGDIDYLEVFPKSAAEKLEEIAGMESKLSRKHGVFVHGAGHIEMPINYEERLQEMDLRLKYLRLFAPDPYDLLLSKMLRNSGKDREDAKFLIAKLSLRFGIFKQRFDEEMDWVSNRPYRETTLRLWKDFFLE